MNRLPTVRGRHAVAACRIAAVVLLLGSAVPVRKAAAQSFSFAGYTFDQSDTPDTGANLSPGTYSGAVVTAAPTGTANVSGFPAVTSGFDASRSVGRLTGLSSSGTRAENLPNGNNGASARSGFVLSWSGGRKLYNAAGDDFLVYESASTPTGPEGYAVQVYRPDSATWSDWHYEPAEAFQLYNGQPAGGEGAHVTAFDLSTFGLAAGEPIDRIRIVNLTDEDRMESSTGSGRVLPEDAGATSAHLPAPGPLAGYTSYGSSTLDPDPIYVTTLHATSTTACGNGVVDSGEQCDTGVDVPLDCCGSSCQFESDSTGCDDSLFCTSGDSCQAGSCSGAPLSCSDGNDCTTDSCNEASDLCTHDAAASNGASCVDGLFCTENDTCQDGSCDGTPVACDDSNPCTADSCDEGDDACVHDSAPLDSSSCDDGTACTSDDRCDAGTCHGSETLVCGDGLRCGVEQCDDGNTDELDTCSSTCRNEASETSAQRTCLKKLNAAADRVAQSQTKQAQACLKGAAAGTLTDAQTCLTGDPDGRIAKARARTATVKLRSCPVEPDFGETDTDRINDAAVDETTALTADIFGGNLGSAAAPKATAAAGARCQAAVFKATAKLFAARRKEFLRCKGAGLDADQIRSDAGLHGCLAAVLVDGKGKIAAARSKLAATLADTCTGLDLAATFPGVCGSAAAFDTCLDTRSNCRVCRLFAAADDFVGSCDSFDDGLTNSSCE